jgi:peptidyl-prolyl cis-trans isomerase SurA
MLLPTRSCLLLLLAGLIAFAAVPNPSWAQGARIAAVVNDDIVTTSDVMQRVRMAMLETGTPDNPENRERLSQQMLRQLIDERLMMQEATRSKVTPSDAGVDDAVTRIAQQNNMSLDDFERALLQQGVSADTVKDRTRAVLSWQGLVQRRMLPTIDISDDAVQAEIDRLKASIGKPLYLISEIVLSTDRANELASVRQSAARMVQDLRTGGVRFAALAQQFSQSATAARGGDIGWVDAAQLDPDLASVVEKLPPDAISDPIETLSGIHILQLRGKRALQERDPDNAMVKLRQVILRYGANTGREREQAMQQITGLARTAKSCDALGEQAKPLGNSGPADAADGRIGGFRPEVRAIVEKLTEGKLSAPVDANSSLIAFMVCEKQEPPSSIPTEDQMRERLVSQRVELMQRRLMRDLRRAAFVDVRM